MRRTLFNRARWWENERWTVVKYEGEWFADQPGHIDPYVPTPEEARFDTFEGAIAYADKEARK